MNSPRIFITGGHLTPAVAMIDLLLERGWQIYYIGRKYAQEEDSSISVEYHTIKRYKKKVKLLLITTGKLQRYFNLKSLLSLLKIPIGFLQSFYWIVKYHPDVVLSFGSYVALPVSLLAWFFKIPVVTHEQTRSTGLANRLLGKISVRICLTWADLYNSFLSDKAVVTGLPLRKQLLEIREDLPVKLNKPLIYVSGGSLGSHRINELLMPLIYRLSNNFSIIHQCGQTKKYHDYNRLIAVRQKLPPFLKDNYLPIPYIDANKLGWVYKNAMFVVGRAGANTVYELIVFSLPTIFIPLSWSSGNEQYLNAEIFVKNKCGISLNEDEINSEILYNQMLSFSKNLNTYKRNILKLKKLVTLRGAENVFDILKQEIDEKDKSLS